ncbi:MAG: RNA 2',3'-cyclic phosphodiesterase [Firmicutes bacterium HGW-Firmicutes-16]|nr:MAG: RNA 2',3'-cyclic phosphodiesterase [Firmicutes bacterium HGW-Firmicutes-16]
MRLFIAVHFSNEVKFALLSAIEELSAQAVSGNFTRPENLHLTLAFIGESEDVQTIRSVIDRCVVPVFEMAILGAGNFGKLHWVGIENNPKLKALAENIQNELRKSGFDIEDRAFKPHITIARKLETRSPVNLNVTRKAMSVSRISLMKSDRIDGRLTYTEVYGRDLKSN